MEKQLPIALLIVGLVIGMGIGYVAAPDAEPDTPDSVEDPRVAELMSEVEMLEGRIEDARNKFDTEIYSVTAEILSIDGNVMVLGKLRQPNPLLDIPDTMNVTASGSTAITRRIYKDSAAYARELAVFHDEIGPAGLVPKGVTPPSPYLTQSLTLQDLEVGMDVEATSPELIEGSGGFVASRVEIVNES